MIGVTELKAGTIYEENGQLLQVISYEHVKMGRGSANIKVKVKNLTTGATTINSFMNGARVNDVQITKRELQFLYKDDDNAFFMHPQTYEQVTISLKKIDGHEYLKEGESFQVSFRGEDPLSVLLPPKMVFAVSDTAPGVRGNSATNVFKDAVLENGVTTKVPLFVSIGDKIRIDTRTGAYTEKAT